ncbi:hypothetical protein ABPG75_010472 [Micractinium tetrahymenae]
MLWLIAGFASLAGFLFGYDLGLIGGALLNIRDDFGIGDWTAELIVGAAKFGAFFGTFLGGALMLHYGRRKAIAIDSAFFIVGPLIMAASAGVAGLVVGRVVVGMGIGISATVVPAYLGEVAPARVRGRVVESFELLLCAGMLAAALGDAAFQPLPSNWRWMVGAPVVPALLLSLSLWLLPESPRWLVIRGRLDEALAVIHRMYTHRILPAGMQHSTAEVEEELMQLWSSVEKDREAAQAQRAQHAERQRRRQEQRETKVAPLSSGGEAGAGGGGDSAARWQRLQPLEDDEEEGLTDATAAAQTEEAAGAPGTPLGAPGADRRVEHDAEDPHRGLLPAGAARSSDGTVPGLRHIRTGSVPAPESDQHDLEELPLHDEEAQGALPGAGAGQGGLEAGRGGRQAAGQPAAQQQQQQQQHAINEEHKASPGASPSASSASGSRWQPAGEQQHQPVTARHGAGQAGFWRTFRDMIGDIHIVACGPERQALLMSLWLAFFNQAFASTSIINYAPQVLERAGVESHSAASLLTSTVGGSKMLGVLLSFFLVDSLGRRPLLLWGSLGCAAALAALAVADWLALRAFLVAGMCAFIFAFSISWAGVFWVLLSELFSMSAKSPAASAATATLFLTGAVADTLFLTLHSLLGAFVFVLFALLAAAAGLYVVAVVPETKGRRLEAMTVEPAGRATLAGTAGAAGAAPQLASSQGGGAPWWRRWRRPKQERLLPDGAVRSDAPGAAVELAPHAEP